MIDIFKPFRLLRNGHAQTIYASFKKLSLQPEVIEHFVIHLPDGDGLLAHDCHPFGKPATDPAQIAIMFHGLGGSFRSPFMLRIAAKLVQEDVRVFGVDSRGCGVGANLARDHSHAGRSSDFHVAVSSIAERFPNSCVTLIGFSLGGNTLLSYLGQFAEDVPGNVSSAIAVAPPIDLIECSRRLKVGLSRFYDYYYARNMLRQLQRRRKENRNLRDRTLDTAIETIFDFDSNFTAPLAGFNTAWDYYHDSSAVHSWNEIRVPTRILVAADDPVVPVTMFEDGCANPQVKIELTEHGGHLGYYADQPVSTDRWWLDWWICRNILTT